MALAPVAEADDAEASLWSVMGNGEQGVMFDVENDFFTGSDRNYTNGLRLTYQARDPKTYCTGGTEVANAQPEGAMEASAALASLAAAGADAPPSGARCQQINDRGRDAYRTTVGMHLASNMYTPADITLKPEQIPPDDRPYGGWTYVGLFRERHFESERYSRWEFDLGCIGPCSRAERIQKWWHDLIDDDEPMGWDAQISNAPAIQWMYETRPFGVKAFGTKDNRWLDLAPAFTTQFGTVFANVGVEATARFSLGRMEGYFEGRGIKGNMPKALKPIQMKDADRKCGLCIEEAFLFVRAGSDIVFHNSLIEGSVIDDDSPFTQDPRWAIVDLEYGIVVHWSRLSLSYSYATRSTEIKSQPFDLAHHRWGQVQITGRWGK